MPSSSNLCSRQVNLRNFSLEFPPGVNQRRNSSWNFPSGAPEWASREFRMEFIPFQQKQLHELWNSWNLGFFFSSIFPNFSSIFPNYLIYLGQQNQLHGIQKFPEFPLFQIHFSHFLVLLVSQIIYFLQEKHLHGLWNSWNFPFFWSIFFHFSPLYFLKLFGLSHSRKNGYLDSENSLQFPHFLINFFYFFLSIFPNYLIYLFQPKWLHRFWNSWNSPFFCSIFPIFFSSPFSQILKFLYSMDLENSWNFLVSILSIYLTQTTHFTKFFGNPHFSWFFLLPEPHDPKEKENFQLLVLLNDRFQALWNFTEENSRILREKRGSSDSGGIQDFYILWKGDLFLSLYIQWVLEYLGEFQRGKWEYWEKLGWEVTEGKYPWKSALGVVFPSFCAFGSGSGIPAGMKDYGEQKFHKNLRFLIFSSL